MKPHAILLGVIGIVMCESVEPTAKHDPVLLSGASGVLYADSAVFCIAVKKQASPGPDFA